MTLVDIAQAKAFEVHFGHINKHDGEIYLKHLQRVAIDVRDRGLDEVHQAVAWLHDSVEDWPERITIGDIADLFPEHPEIAVSVNALTKRKGESNLTYYRRLLEYPIAACVKVYDMNDNFRRNHLIEDEATRARMASKYSLGVDILSRFR